MAAIDKIKHKQRVFIDKWGVIIYQNTIDTIKNIIDNHKTFLENINQNKTSYQKVTDDLCLFLDCDFDITAVERLKLKTLFEIACFLLENKITYLCKN